jgi:hypothetical protein
MNGKSYLENFSKSIDKLISNVVIDKETNFFIKDIESELKQVYNMIDYAVSLNKDSFNNEQNMPRRKDYKVRKNKKKGVKVKENDFFSFLFSNNKQVFNAGYQRRKRNFIEQKYSDLDFKLLDYNHQNFLETDKNVQLLTKDMFENLWLVSKINVYDKKFNYDKGFRFDENFYFKNIVNQNSSEILKAKNYLIQSLIIGPVEIEKDEFCLKVKYSETKIKNKGLIRKKEIIERNIIEYIIDDKDIYKLKL